MSKYPVRSPEATLNHQLSKAGAFCNRVVRGINHLKPSKLARRRLEALIGINGCMGDMRLCDVVARQKAAEILFEVIDDLEPVFDEPSMRFFHITFADDLGLTSDRTPILRVGALKRKVYKAIRALGLSAIVEVENQPLLNYPAGGEGRTLMLHAHAIAWGKVSRRKFQDAKKELNGSRSWKNAFDAQPVMERELFDFDEVRRMACYVAKLPHDGKIRVPKGDGYRFQTVLQGYPDRLALRIAEGLSHYSIFDAVFSVGDGKHLRSIWKRRLVEWHRDRLNRASKVHDFDVDAFWRRRHSSKRSGYDKPFEID
ncbi:hypothetical protein [Novosphingobium sp.]|uniref:hypothetical protein n=1 Tax=Novosphingobium sp. TaxID=1874826 RepID=UPI003BABE4AC